MTQLIYAIIIGISVGAMSGYLGSIMLTKRMALVGGPLGHLALPGISFALLYNFDVSLGALLFISFGTTIIWLLEKYTKLPVDALSALVFASTMAVSFLFLDRSKTVKALFGDISKLNVKTAVIIAVVSLVIIIVTKFLIPKMVLISISPSLAQTTKINTNLYQFIFMFCVAVTISLGVRIVGGLMTAALVAVPACTARNLCRTLKSYTVISLIAGLLSCATGVVAFFVTGLPVGPMIIISSTVLFLVSLVFKR